MGGLLKEGAHGKSPKCLGGNLGDFGGILQRSRDINVLKPLEKAKFIYTVSAGDSKASAGMAQVGKMLKQDKVSYAETEFSAKLPQTEQDAKVQQMLAQVKRINFIRFAPNTVIPENSTHKGAEHMYSFDYAYLLEPARDWLMQQRREK